MSVPGNIDLQHRPRVPNPETGGISTLYSMSFNEGGKEILVPRVAVDGSRILSPQEAIDQYHKTGQHLGMFDSPEEATKVAIQLHKDQEAMGEPSNIGWSTLLGNAISNYTKVKPFAQ